MYDLSSREQKALRMVKLFEHYFGKEKLKQKTVLDVGASTGILDNILARHFKKVIGIDIDEGAIKHAKQKYKSKNLIFEKGDAMKLKYKESSFDVVICAQVYEHVPDVQKLFDEIYRVLKKNGICYLAALNSLWPIEPHYNLPFLSVLPKSLAHKYMQIFNKGKNYYETPRSYWELKKMCGKFTIFDYTPKILNSPKTFGYDDKINGVTKTTIAKALAPITPLIAPTFFWLLKK